MSEMISARELIARQYQPGSSTTNCVVHSGMPIDDRPFDCLSCLTDLRNTLRRAWRTNEWLNEWRDEAIDVLARQETGFALLQGYAVETKPLSDYDARLQHGAQIAAGEVAAVVRYDNDGQVESVLLDGLSPAEARRVLAELERVLQVADGTISVADVVGGPRPTSL